MFCAIIDVSCGSMLLVLLTLVIHKLCGGSLMQETAEEYWQPWLLLRPKLGCGWSLVTSWMTTMEEYLYPREESLANHTGAEAREAALH